MLKRLMLLSLLAMPLYAQQYGWVKVAQLGGLKTVDFVDSLHGWTCFGSSNMYRTTDGGSTWIESDSQNPMAVYSLSFSDVINGWAVGSQASLGKIIRTKDGGRTWTEQLANENRSYVSTKAQTKDRITVAGSTQNYSPDTGKIVRTNNGGTTWSEETIIDSGNVVGFNKVYFLDSLHGWISGGIVNIGPAIWRTIDGGNTWTMFPTPQGFYGLSFIDTLNGWGAYSDYMFHTTDGGATWQFQTYMFDPDPYVSNGLMTNAISFVDSLNGWAFGVNADSGIITEEIMRTTDGGWHWHRESIGLTPDLTYASDGKMLDSIHGWAVCTDGSVLRYELVTGVAERLPKVPQHFSLHQNYPNPFNPITTIEYELTQRADVLLKVYDILGKEITTLVNQLQQPGAYRVRFDASKLPSGVYYYTLDAGASTETKQMQLIK